MSQCALRNKSDEESKMSDDFIKNLELFDVLLENQNQTA